MNQRDNSAKSVNKKNELQDSYHDIFLKKLNALLYDPKKKMTMKEINEKLDTHKDYITSIAAGRSYPSFKIFYLICRLFKVHPKYFFMTKTHIPLSSHGYSLIFYFSFAMHRLK